ncbi:MAG: sterol desaturase family protein [Gammaproteobacteria bacterium]|uniref:Sterol desaturase family protein n=1 Tax=Candidatus Thiopontia autotrophica TaxID=2841688 RepID=A0A8J6TNJ7_9GAMM|nr:sterol desaturase family protein [Candidatus Thiopontia autotrophica]MBL6969475.1 sterol desaturase family protein [Gammaproteobacteria bacterium]
MVEIFSLQVQANESVIRLSAFLGIFAVMALWELAAPRRRLSMGRGVRWGSNLGIVAINTVLVRLLFPVAAAGFAMVVSDEGWGLMNQVDLGVVTKIVMALLVLDFAIYLQHRLFHAVPLLWRLHRMHHADLDYDVTTGARFHPIEIILSMVIKFGVILLIGAPVVAVILFEVLLNATAMFNHGNVRLPLSIDSWLRWIVVTPDMHRVHHSVIRRETDSNFGFNLPWWDRLLGTYIAQPEEGHQGMEIGLPQFRHFGDNRLDRMLVQPFYESLKK